MRGFAAVVTGVGLLASACVGSPSQTATVGSSSGTAESTSAGSTTATDASDTGVAPPGCGENLLGDPGFEDGTPNSVWGEESALFATPVCDAGCTDDVGANPFTGSWWVWFGGVAQPDTARVWQRVVIPEGNAILRFRFSLNAASGTGNDVFSVMLDEETLLEVSDAQAASYGGWRVVEVDIPPSFVDGGEHTLSFGATLSGVGVTNFFLDDVELLLCELDSSSSSSSSSGDDGTTGLSATSSADASGR